jgi:hypothetical protein
VRGLALGQQGPAAHCDGDPGQLQVGGPASWLAWLGCCGWLPGWLDGWLGCCGWLAAWAAWLLAVAPTAGRCAYGSRLSVPVSCLAVQLFGPRDGVGQGRRQVVQKAAAVPPLLPPHHLPRAQRSPRPAD